MKNTISTLIALTLCGSALAGPIDDKVNAYNAIRGQKISTPMDLNIILRNEAGVVSSSTGKVEICTTCSMASSTVARTRASTTPPSYTPANAPAAVADPIDNRASSAALELMDKQMEALRRNMDIMPSTNYQ